MNGLDLMKGRRLGPMGLNDDLQLSGIFVFFQILILREKIQGGANLEVRGHRLE